MSTHLLPTAPLAHSELSVTSKISGRAFVVRGGASNFDASSLASVLAHLRSNAQAIKQQVRSQGVLLFRGLPMRTPEHYEAALEALGYDLYRDNLGGASPRSNVTRKTFVSTEAPAPFIIGLHTEFCYQTTRPGMISFFCVTPAAGFGETPLFDCNAVLRDLPAPLRDRLLRDGLLYRRNFFGRKSALNFRKTWRETFGTTDRADVERYLNAEGMRYRWDAEENLSTELNLPAVLNDPQSGLPCLSITMFNADSFIYNFRHFKDRYHPLLRMGLEWFVRREYSRPDTFLQVLHGNGEAFSREESWSIQRAAWDNAIVFPWQTGDLLLIDNILYGHARLNVRKPRRLIAAMADPYDVRSLQGATRAVPDAVLAA